MKNIKKAVIFFAGLILVLTITIIFANAKNNDETTSSNTSESTEIVNKNDNNINLQYIRVIHAPKSATFAEEEVPLEYFDIVESFERELTQIAYSHQHTLLTVRLAGRYFGLLDSLLQQNNVPTDFKYLCVAESNLQNIISPAKAVGFWQFLQSTGKQYGLEINDEVDERYNIEKSTVATCSYLKDAYKKYGNWTLAAASYNTGVGNIDKIIESQKTNNYYDMILHPETTRYIFRILAYKTILSNPENYGFYLTEEEKFEPFKYSEITINKSIPNIAEFAKEHDTNYKIIKILNPWLRKDSLTNKLGKTYKIKIPAKGFREVK
jgi:hypothetical protein